MCGRFGNQKSQFVLVAVAGLVLSASVSEAQQAVTLPVGWQQMSPIDFAALIRSLQGQFKALSQTDQNALAAHGKQLFLQVNVLSTSFNYQTLEMLHWVCRFSLPATAIDQTRKALLARQDNWTGQPYAEIRAKVMMMSHLEMMPASLVREAQRWVAAGGTLAQVPQADLNYDIVREGFSNAKVISGSFSVQWTGLINVPQSGDYTFVISPINIDTGFNPHPVKFRMTVSVAGQSLLESIPSGSGNPSFPGYQPFPPKPPAWTSRSNPVTLTAGQPASLQVTVSADVVRDLPEATLHAMLYWEGPGLSKSLVPASSLTVPSGNAPGLQATYSWTNQSRPQNLTRTDPMIDFAWTNAAILLSRDMTTANQAANEMWQTMTSANFLATLTGPPVQLHPFFENANDAASGLSTSQRQAFLDLVLQNPALLDPVDAKTAVRFYQAFRMGTPGKALDVFGVWSTRHADILSELSNERVFDADNSTAFAALAINTTQQLPDQVARLQNEYLQLPDGRCSLPVAYTLGYSYLGRGKASDWIAILDAKLADPSVIGDARVNWLMARGTAQEFGRAQPRHYPIRTPFPGRSALRGRKYFEQAVQAAQSPGVKLRAAHELAALLVWAQRYDAAVAVLQPLSNSVPAAQQALLAAWIGQLHGYAGAQTQYLANRQVNARRTYVTTLRARRDKAASLGDTASVNRYNALINAAQNNTSNP